jgi:catechol 2,3-dioxygenase-like lactoylglutathione lyase family enzyme
MLKMEEGKMKLTHSCIITNDVPKLTKFYNDVLQIEPQGEGSYIEFPTENGILSLFSLESMEQYAPNSTQTASNESIILEFEVKDVDKEYDRLRGMEIKWVMYPANLPWGIRAIYFHDPDGNLINFYTKI